jgi:hypothetical protein
LEIFQNTPFIDAKDFTKEIYNSATIEVSRHRKLKSFSILEQLDHKQKIVFFGRDKYESPVFHETNDKRVEFSNKEKFFGKLKKLNITKYRNSITKELKNGNYVILLAENKEDIDIFHHIYLYENKYIEKLIISIHESPDIINRELITGSNILGAFSQSKESASAVARILFGKTKASSLKNMPIDINDGTYFDTSERSTLIIDEKANEKVVFFKTPQEKKLFDKINDIKKQFIYAVSTSLILIIALLLILVYVIAVHIDITHAPFKKREVLHALNPKLFPLRHPFLTAILVALVYLQSRLLVPDSWVNQKIASTLDSKTQEFLDNRVLDLKSVAPEMHNNKITAW